MTQLRRFVPALLFTGISALTIPALVRGEGDGDKTFKANCVLCHAVDGSGNTSSGKAFKVPDLRGDSAQKMTDEQLNEVITHGKNKMPAFGKKLKPEDIKQLVAFVRALPKSK